MGIQGLLSFLDKASRPASVSEFSGYTVAIDSYCWLHKGAFSCAEKLARGEKTDQYVKFCMKFVNMLLSYNVKPILVFDGRHLPAKAETEKKRRELRETNRKKAAELLRLERESEARSLIQRCVDVTHDMALALMKECRAQGVDCIVAPFEADAQLAYLNLNGYAHLVVTEDSDLLLFGCKRVLFKMDVYGNGVLVEQSKIPLAMKVHPNQFSMDKFRYMCILSGCDYLKSLPGIGLAKACKFIKKTQDDNISRALTRMGAYLNMSNLEVTIDYREKFVAADAMFKHQPVFDPQRRTVVPLTPLPPDTPNPLPTSLDPEVSYQLALGNLNPFTLEKVDSWDPDQPQSIRTSSWKSSAHHHKSIWSKDYKKPKPLPAQPDPRDVKHPTTKGKTLTQPVSNLTQQIATLTAKPSVDSELTRLRESFGVKLPPAKRLCVEESDSGIGTESSSEELTPSNSDEVVLPPFNAAGQNSSDLTVDDILGEAGSPVLIRNQSRNPFHARRTPLLDQPPKPQCGALDMFSKLKKTQVEAAFIVQSRYFASDAAGSEFIKKSPKKKKSTSEETDMNGTLFEIIHATPSPKRKTSLLFKTKTSSSPRKNLFEVADINESISSPTKKNIFKVIEVDGIQKEKEQLSNSTCKSPEVATPRKNVFAVTRSPKSSSPQADQSPRKRLFSATIVDRGAEKTQSSPKEQSFLKILNEVSKEVKVETSEKVEKKLSRGSFKWSQPLFDVTKKTGTENSLLELYKPKQKLSQLPLRSLKGNTLKGGGSSARKLSLPNNANFKKKPPSTPSQKSLLNMFAFQPKPKLKTQ